MNAGDGVIWEWKAPNATPEEQARQCDYYRPLLSGPLWTWATQPRRPRLFDVERLAPWWDGDFEWIEPGPDRIAQAIRHIAAASGLPGAWLATTGPTSGEALGEDEFVRRARELTIYKGTAVGPSISIDRFGGTYSMTKVPASRWWVLLRPWYAWQSWRFNRRTG